jgi:SSS family solute:Na+ symporter
MVLGILLSELIGKALMGEGKQGFQYIQEYTGFVSPGIFAMFILGFFWKKATSNAAMFATIGGFIMSCFFKLLPRFADLGFLSPYGFSKLALQDDKVTKLYEIPFLDRMGFVFVICVVGMYIISKIDGARGVKTNGLEIDGSMFKTSRAFTAGALIVTGIVIALYSIFW